MGVSSSAAAFVEELISAGVDAGDARQMGDALSKHNLKLLEQLVNQLRANSGARVDCVLKQSVERIIGDNALLSQVEVMSKDPAGLTFLALVVATAVAAVGSIADALIFTDGVPSTVVFFFAVCLMGFAFVVQYVQLFVEEISAVRARLRNPPCIPSKQMEELAAVGAKLLQLTKMIGDGMPMPEQEGEREGKTEI